MTDLVPSHELFAICYAVSRRANRSAKYRKVSSRRDAEGAEVAAESSRVGRRFFNCAG